GGGPAPASRARKITAAAQPRASAAQRVRLNQRAFYQAFAAFERHRLVRRLGADDRQRPDERYRLDERDFSGVYEFTDLIDRFLPPAGLVAYGELNPEKGGDGGAPVRTAQEIKGREGTAGTEKARWARDKKGASAEPAVPVEAQPAPGPAASASSIGMATRTPRSTCSATCWRSLARMAPASHWS